MPSAHSEHSASGFEAKMLCPGKPVLEAAFPATSSKYADEGTAAHALLEYCINDSKPAAAFMGRLIPVDDKHWPVDDDMAGAIQTALDNIGQIAGPDAMVLSETRVFYNEYLGVHRDKAFGTCDIIALRGSELQVHDYKHGRGVEVDAENNAQLMLYALGALPIARELADIDTVRLVIHQPRIKSAPSEATISVADLEAWGRSTARSAVATCHNAAELYPVHVLKGTAHTRAGWERTFLRPNDKSCKFCRAKATCPALREAALETVFASAPASPDEFDDVGVPAKEHIQAADEKWLGAVLAKADLIDDWLSSVRAEVTRRLTNGEQVPGWKLVTGKRGNRTWKDAAAAEDMLKNTFGLRVDQAYDLKLISPTTAEKLAKDKVIGPRQWTKVQELIYQPEGKPAVAPETDKRPALAITPVADGFEVIATSPVSEFA